MAEERLVRGYGGNLLVVVSLGWLTLQGGRLLLPPLLPTVIEALAITPFRAGVALSVLWGLYALCQYPSGHYSDHLSRKTLIVAGLTLGCLGFTLLYGAVTYPRFLVGVAVVGVGVGLYPTAARALISDHFEARRGGAFGLHTASGDVGGGAAAGLAVVALAVGTWRTAFLPIVAILAVLLLVVHRLSREPYTVETVALDVRTTGRRLFAESETRWLVFAYCLFAASWQGTAGFLPTYLQQTKGFSPELASAGFAGLFLVGAVVKPLAGDLGDRTRRGPVAVGALLVGALALATLVAAHSTVAVVAATVVYAAGLMAFPPVMQSHLMSVFPDGSMGGDLGLARTVYIGVGSLGPTYIGFVAQHASYDVAFAGLVCGLVVGTVVVWLTLRGNT
ncbi:MAG: MFS transporter [Haloferacaceae archaeon]